MQIPFFICPICRSPLSSSGKSYICDRGHSYDISREGYVNLLPPNRKQSREPGDSKEMLSARRNFLEKGHYRKLAEIVYSIAREYCQQSASSFFNILDAGCGEGYYTAYISERFSAEYTLKNIAKVYGIDISKEGIRLAAKRRSPARFAVAGIHDIPAADSSARMIINIFSPFSGTEFCRILSGDGVIVSVTPGSDHMLELKANLYDEVYFNDEEFTPPDGLVTVESSRLKFRFMLNESVEIQSLLKMTPYYHKSSRDSISKFIASTESLEITADFIIRIIKKKSA